MEPNEALELMLLGAALTSRSKATTILARLSQTDLAGKRAKVLHAQINFAKNDPTVLQKALLKVYNVEWDGKGSPLEAILERVLELSAARKRLKAAEDEISKAEVNAMRVRLMPRSQRPK